MTRPNPAPRPNRRLSAPNQYGHPWTWRETLAVLVVVLGLIGIIVMQVTQ